jgi:hypothetical protein
MADCKLIVVNRRTDEPMSKGHSGRNVSRCFGERISNETIVPKVAAAFIVAAHRLVGRWQGWFGIRLTQS